MNIVMFMPVGFLLGVAFMKIRWKAVLFIWIVMISVSVLFVKQHSYYDVVAALPLGLLAELLVYWKPYWKPRLMGKRSETLS